MTHDEICSYINKTPELMSLLYDLDLLPEQTVNQLEKFKTENIVEHFKLFAQHMVEQERDRCSEVFKAARIFADGSQARADDCGFLARKVLDALSNLTQADQP